MEQNVGGNKGNRGDFGKKIETARYVTEQGPGGDHDRVYAFNGQAPNFIGPTQLAALILKASQPEDRVVTVSLPASIMEL